MFDPEQRRVGYVPVGPESANCYPISPYSSGGLQTSCRKPMEHNRISVELATRCYDLKMMDGVLVANLGACWGDRVAGAGLAHHRAGASLPQGCPGLTFSGL